MSPQANLNLINFLIGDIQGGLGPFLGTYLARTGEWTPSQVGLLITACGFAGLALSGPLGAVVDRLGRPRLLIALACAAILAGTLLILPAKGFVSVSAAQMLATAGGTLLLPAVTALTLGVVGKKAFPEQQGRNQAFNHLGVLIAAGLISLGAGWLALGPTVAFWVLAVMAAGAILATLAMPSSAFDGRRAVGWDDDTQDHERAGILSVLGNRRLLVLAIALALFNLGNGNMLTLLGQKLVATDGSGTHWTAVYVMVAQGTMVPIAYLAGRYAGHRGCRKLLIVALAVLPVRAVLSAFLDDPYWLMGAEVLDGVGSAIVGVAVPIVVADLTWGSGRTQTAIGAVNAVQGIGGALSGWYGGFAYALFGWTGSFLALGAPALVGLVIAVWLDATKEPGRRSRHRDAATVPA